MNKLHNIALIFGGGVGVRASTNGIPKQFLKVNEVPIIIRTIKKFDNNKDIDAIVLVCVDGYQQYLKRLLTDFNITKVAGIVTGGTSGQESIYKGLRYIGSLSIADDAIVLIHDAVRPMITLDLINDCIESTKVFGNGISALVCHETVASCGNGVVNEIYPRDKLSMLRAPQAFYYKDIWQCHKQSLQDGFTNFTDSANMAAYYGHKLHLVTCDSKNIKITYPEDVFILKALLTAEENSQILGL